TPAPGESRAPPQTAPPPAPPRATSGRSAPQGTRAPTGSWQRRRAYDPASTGRAHSTSNAAQSCAHPLDDVQEFEEPSPSSPPHIIAARLGWAGRGRGRGRATARRRGHEQRLRQLGSSASELWPAGARTDRSGATTKLVSIRFVSLSAR